jgi:hypothetical protein
LRQIVQSALLVAVTAIQRRPGESDRTRRADEDEDSSGALADCRR